LFVFGGAASNSRHRGIGVRGIAQAAVDMEFLPQALMAKVITLSFVVGILIDSVPRGSLQARCAVGCGVPAGGYCICKMDSSIRGRGNACAVALALARAC